ncbi:CRISPR-associated helicase Cas3' [Mariniblastus fucicola]|nr:CRISPR-associated helicase Cas3' [Mariniblastus fucicola]
MQQHEDLVAEYCARFLKRIDPSLEAWGELLGKWHDLGKYSERFQNYIAAANHAGYEGDSDGHRAEVRGSVDHSTAAAKLAVRKFGDARGRLLSYSFAGHHAGLPDWDDGKSQSGLKQRLHKEIADWQSNAPSSLVDFEFPGMPQFKKPKNRSHAAFRVAFWIRIVFSALVDADFLATESFMSPGKSAQRPGQSESFIQMRELLEAKLARLTVDADATEVNRIRTLIGQQCKEKATLPNGLFSLCVPTGGGKTLASLRFALTHAIENNLDRVIVAVPFTSIIEQNADVYRKLFASLDSELMLEHHSNLDPEKDTTTSRLQSENWDASLVVTTNVQLFESLFASKTSRCRKLHRIANSVIILDEAQTLPIELLQSTMMALQELVDSYGCTVVLCSATQPALKKSAEFKIGLEDITPIIDDPQQLHQSLVRTRVEVAGKIGNEELAENIRREDQVLCIVNTRAEAAELFERLNDSESDSSFHLSTRMCASHRTRQLDNIRERLKNGESCRVVSTQLIEAGVDVDFPVVYRASCGLDSLAQAAGRCNREGKLDCGRVVLFEGENLPPPGFLRQSADSGKELIDEFADDLLSPQAIESYFRLHYWKKSDAWDYHRVLAAIGNRPSDMQFNFREIAQRYRFIKDDTETLLVGWDEKGDRLIEELAKSHPFLHRNTLRRLQRYSVQVRQYELGLLKAAGAIELVNDHWVLSQSHLYDDKLGLQLSRADGVLPVEDCII